ncbi:uncharacterized abhydrolase domain-containing protein DDB_G0269086 isoform X2 [Betta splendens]|uniref:Uncharacterized abhydrolase domain-containing protein DDB_G0269086 isoform X2 n=1 Tax=Betta splendens TaxID=158456 RepID=A0A9W2XG75_BETSP|nr:uncharacterized abhydrolase domain-containing protein DDB_G0269086 isoform X2 [Betta splendens]
MAMAQSSSCPNPDLSTCAIVHSPQSISSDLNTQREIGNDDGEEEEEEVELAEEVGEDVLMMGEEGEEGDEGESEQQSEREEVRFIEVALFPNGAIREEEGKGKKLEENFEGAVEAEEKDQEKLNEQAKEEMSEAMTKGGSEDTNVGVEHQCDVLPMTNTEKVEDMRNEQYKQDILKREADVREEQINEEDSRLNDHQITSPVCDVEIVEESSLSSDESVVATQSSDDTSKTNSAVLSNNNETERIEGSITFEDSTEVDEEVTVQHDPCHISTVLFGTVDVLGTDRQTVQVTSEHLDKMKDTDKRGSESSIQHSDSITWQQSDVEQATYEIEENNEFYVQSASSAVLDIEAETNLEETQPQLDFVPLEALSQTEGRIEEISLEGINQTAHEDEQVRQVGVNTLIGTDGGGKTTEEEWKACDNVVSELMDEEEDRRKGDKGMNEESTVQFEKQAMVALEEPTVKFVEEDTLEAKQHVDLDQVEEAFELEEHCEVELDQTEGEVTSDKNESKTEGNEFQDHSMQLLGETRTDCKSIFREQPQNQITIQHENDGEELEDTMVEEVEMAEEPVTVLDDEIEETEENQTSEEQELATCEETTSNTKDTEFQEPEEKDQKQKGEKGTGQNDKKPTDDMREVELDINGKVNKLRKAMENGILCPEPHQLRKQEWGTARLRSPRRKDNDWIKNDEPEDSNEIELKDWRKELKPVKRDWENEGGRKEWMKKDSPPEETAPPKRDDWIKELKSVIKDESLPKKRSEQGKKKRVVLLEDGHSYIPQREEITEDKKEEVKLISHKRVESPLPYVRRNSKTPQDQEYEISLYVKTALAAKTAGVGNIMEAEFHLR